jgi:hypothetical protein
VTITVREVSWICIVAGLLALVQGAYQAVEINGSWRAIDRGLVHSFSLGGLP